MLLFGLVTRMADSGPFTCRLCSRYNYLPPNLVGCPRPRPRPCPRSDSLRLGELFYHLTRLRKIPEAGARVLAAELVLALGHLHSHAVVFRDLKPENILLDGDGHVRLGRCGLLGGGRWSRWG